VVKVDVDADPELAVRFGAPSIPPLVVLRDGREVDRNVGALPRQALEARLEPVLAGALVAVSADTSGVRHPRLLREGGRVMCIPPAAPLDAWRGMSRDSMRERVRDSVALRRSSPPPARK
jgi:hypothetical protein